MNTEARSLVHGIVMATHAVPEMTRTYRVWRWKDAKKCATFSKRMDEAGRNPTGRAWKCGNEMFLTVSYDVATHNVGKWSWNSKTAARIRRRPAFVTSACVAIVKVS